MNLKINKTKEVQGCSFFKSFDAFDKGKVSIQLPILSAETVFKEITQPKLVEVINSYNFDKTSNS